MKRYIIKMIFFVIYFHILPQGKFREDNFSSAMATLRDAGDAAKGDKRGRRGGFKGTYFLY
jgi:ATP-dependent RNA helicase DOB1